MTDKTAAEQRLAELQATATRADMDTEDKLIHLEHLKDQLREDPVVKREYEALRDELAAQLEREGPRYYLDNMGVKRYAYAVVPEPIEVDVDELCRLDEAGELKAGVLDQVAPRKADKERYRAAVQRGDITREQFLATAKVGRGTAYVKSSDPVDAD